MDTEEAYDHWSRQYDTNRNLTRDREAIALRDVLADVAYGRCLEIGCGTGKNTEWLATRFEHVTAVDLSVEMLAVARTKVTAPQVMFHQADMLLPWSFAEGHYDLVTFSLVLEHIEHLGPIMRNAASVLKPGGPVYIGELHPFKQYSGNKARFETEQGMWVVPCFDHHVSEFVRAAKSADPHVQDVQEFLDDDNASSPPRVLVLLLKKSA